MAERLHNRYVMRSDSRDEKLLYCYGRLPQDLRVSEYYCYECCEILPENSPHKVCEKCYEKLSESMRKIRRQKPEEDHIWRKIQNYEVAEILKKRGLKNE